MKKFLKFVMWLVVVVVVLIVGAHFAIKGYLNSAGFKKMVAEQVDKNVHRKAELGGISYSIFPPSLLIHNVALKEKDGTENFVAFREFSLRYDYKKKEVTAIVLREPEVQIVQYADGSFNFSDMIPAKPKGEVQPTATPKPKGPKAPTEDKKPVELKEMTLPISIALVQIENAKFNFTRLDEKGEGKPFILSGLNLDIRNIRLDQPVLFQSSVKIGKTSSLEWTLDLGPLRTLPPDLANMPIALKGQLQLKSFEDLAAFMGPEQLEALPVTALEFTWTGTGNIAAGFTFDLKAVSPEVGGRNKLFINMDTKVQAELPEAVMNNLLYNMPLPEEFRFTAPAIEDVPGEINLAATDTARLLLKTLALETTLKTDRLAYEKNVVSNMTIQVALKDGAVTLMPLHLELFGGIIEGQASSDLLSYPLAYRLDSLKVQSLQIHEALAANADKLGDSFAEGISGSLEAGFNLNGSGISSNSIRNNLEAKGNFALKDAQKVGTGETFLDRVILKLDHPMLIQFVPEIRTRVNESKARASQITTTRLDYASADFNLVSGVASLDQLKVGTVDYTLEASGKAWPFDDKLEMKARMRFSPEATKKLTGDRDLSEQLPYENGGLVVPMTLTGSLKKPVPLPDIDFIVKNLTSKQIQKGLDSLLKKAGESDKPEVKQGLQMLDNLLGGEKKQDSTPTEQKPESQKQDQPKEINADKLIKGLGGLFNK